MGVHDSPTLFYLPGRGGKLPVRESAHEIALRVGKESATTEDLRTAMIHYRSLFEELVQVPASVERKEVA